MATTAGNWIRFETTTDAFLQAKGLREDLPSKALYHTNKRVAAGLRKGISQSIRAKWNVKHSDIPDPKVDNNHTDVSTFMSLTYKGERLSLRKFNPRQRGISTFERGRPALINTTRRVGLGQSRKGVSYQGFYESKRLRTPPRNAGVYARILRTGDATLTGKAPIRAHGRFGSYLDSPVGEGPKAFMARGRAGRNHKTKTSGPPSNEATLVFARRGKKRLPIDKMTVAAVPQMMRRKSVLEAIDKNVQERYGRELKSQLEFQFNRELQRIMRAGNIRMTRK